MKFSKLAWAVILISCGHDQVLALAVVRRLETEELYARLEAQFGINRQKIKRAVDRVTAESARLVEDPQFSQQDFVQAEEPADVT